MKRLLTALILIAPLVAFSQTATNSTSFFADAESWFTQFSSNTWNTAHGYVQTGAAYQNNVNVASTFELGYNAYGGTNTSGITVSSETLNAGIAGVIDIETIDAAWRIDLKDVQLQAGLGGGYDWVNKKMFPQVFGEIQKKLTANTHAFLRLDEDWEGKASAPVVSAGIGFTF